MRTRFRWCPKKPGRGKCRRAKAGVIAGLPAAGVILDEMDIPAEFQPLAEDGDAVAAGAVIASIAGPARDLLTSERTLLNLLGRLSGIATFTRQYVEAVAGTTARIYDTRKTTPGWRRLEKYAVHCGGGHNHRTGLYDAILIKDNHLALGREASRRGYSPGRGRAQGQSLSGAASQRSEVPAARPTRE